MLKRIDDLRAEFAELKTSYLTAPADHDEAFLHIIRRGAHSFTFFQKARDKDELLELREFVKDSLVEEADKITKLTAKNERPGMNSRLSVRWRLRESDFLATASRLAANPDEQIALQVRAEMAEKDYKTRTAVLPPGLQSWPFRASELEHDLNKVGVSRAGFPALFLTGMAPNDRQVRLSIRRAPAAVLAFRTKNLSKIISAQHAPEAPADPLDALSDGYETSWNTESLQELLKPRGRDGDVELVWGDVQGRTRLMLWTNYKGAALMVDEVSFKVSVAHESARIAKDGTLSGDAYQVLEVPTIKLAAENYRAQEVSRTIAKAASQELSL